MRTQRNFLWSASSTPGCSLPSLWVGTSPYAVRVSLFCAVASSDYCGIAECTASVTAVTPAGCVLLPTQPRNTAGGRQWWKRSCAFQAQILRTPPGCVCSCQASQEKCGIRCVCLQMILCEVEKVPTFDIISWSTSRASALLAMNCLLPCVTVVTGLLLVKMSDALFGSE